MAVAEVSTNIEVADKANAIAVQGRIDILVIQQGQPQYMRSVT